MGSLGFMIGPTVGGHIAEMQGGFYMVSALGGAMFVLNAGEYPRASVKLGIHMCSAVLRCLPTYILFGLNPHMECGGAAQ